MAAVGEQASGEFLLCVFLKVVVLRFLCPPPFITDAAQRSRTTAHAQGQERNPLVKATVAYCKATIAAATGRQALPGDGVTAASDAVGEAAWLQNLLRNAVASRLGVTNWAMDEYSADEIPAEFGPACLKVARNYLKQAKDKEEPTVLRVLSEKFGEPAKQRNADKGGGDATDAAAFVSRILAAAAAGGDTGGRDGNTGAKDGDGDAGAKNGEVPAANTSEGSGFAVGEEVTLTAMKNKEYYNGKRAIVRGVLTNTLKVVMLEGLKKGEIKKVPFKMATKLVKESVNTSSTGPNNAVAEPAECEPPSKRQKMVDEKGWTAFASVFGESSDHDGEDGGDDIQQAATGAYSEQPQALTELTVGSHRRLQPISSTLSQTSCEPVEHKWS